MARRADDLSVNLPVERLPEVFDTSATWWIGSALEQSPRRGVGRLEAVGEDLGVDEKGTRRDHPGGVDQVEYRRPGGW
jgi:hypothetical protein